MVYYQVLSGNNEKHYIVPRNGYKKIINTSLIIFDVFFVMQNPLL